MSRFNYPAFHPHHFKIPVCARSGRRCQFPVQDALRMKLQAIPPSSLVVSSGWGLMDLPLRASSQFPLLAFKGSLVDPQMRASNEHLPSVRVPRAGGRPGCPSHPSEAARCTSTEDHQPPSPSLFCEQERHLAAPFRFPILFSDRHASPNRIYPAPPTTKVSEITRHGKDGVQYSRDSQEVTWGRTISS